MAKQPMNPTDSFLYDLENVYRSQPVHFQGVEHIKRETYLFLSFAIQQMMRSYYAEHLATVDALRRIWNRNNTLKIEGRQVLAIEDVKPEQAPVLQKKMLDNQASHTIEHPEAIFVDVDQQFSMARETVHETSRLILESAHHQEEEKKQIAVLDDQAKKIDHDYQSVALGGLMIVSGILMVGLTGGIGAAAGAACVMEGVEKIGHLILDNDHHPASQVAQFDHNTTELLHKLTQVDEKNHHAINVAWIKMIEEHLQAQKKLLGEMKSLLESSVDKSDELIHKIDALSENYDQHISALKEADKIEEVHEKFSAVKDFVSKVESLEKSDDTKSLIHSVKEKLPADKKQADHFLMRAKHFFHANEKIIHFTSLMALSIVGVALTVATGGIAGAIGAAILGAVAFNSGKSVVLHLKNAFAQNKSVDHVVETKVVEKNILHQAQDDWIDIGLMHCERQENSVRKISEELTKEECPHVIDALDHAEKEFESSAAAYVALKADHAMRDQEKNRKISEISDSVHEIDERVEKALMQVGENVSEKVKSESVFFHNRAMHFYENNKKVIHSLGKIALAVSAMTVIGVATGGIGFALAFGFAATSWIVKKAAETITSIKQSMKYHQDQHEEEGRRDTKKEEVSVSVPSEHH